MIKLKKEKRNFSARILDLLYCVYKSIVFSLFPRANFVTEKD